MHGHHDWQALLVAASARDPLRMLRHRDFAAMVTRASSAQVALLPVLLTSPSVSAAQQVKLAARLSVLD